MRNMIKCDKVWEWNVCQQNVRLKLTLLNYANGNSTVNESQKHLNHQKKRKIEARGYEEPVSKLLDTSETKYKSTPPGKHQPGMHEKFNCCVLKTLLRTRNRRKR